MSQNISGQERIVHHFETQEFPFSVQTQMKYWFSNQGPVVRTPVSANPGLNSNPGFFFFLSKALLRIIFSIFLAYPIIKL